MSITNGLKKSSDRKVFKHTALKTKKINVNPRVTRGGIKL